MNPLLIDDVVSLITISRRYLQERPDQKLRSMSDPDQGSNIFTSSLKLLYNIVTTKIGTPLEPIIKTVNPPKEREITLESMLKIVVQVKAMLERIIQS